MKDIIKKYSKEIENEVIMIRHHIHENPERSLHEVNTSRFICEKLKEFGIEDINDNVYETAVVAIIKGELPGKTVLLRADMDALPIKECADVSYKSKRDGVMHACGHDAHIAWLLGAAYVLNKIKNKLKGNVKLVFQPSEEEEGGADCLLEKSDILIQEPKVDYAIAGHVWPGIESKKIGIVNGCAMAAANKFNIEIIGRGGHGAEPHKAIDPIGIACEVYTSIQQIVSRKVSPFSSTVITIGVFKGEGAFNIIPDKVVLEGTVRAESYERVRCIMELINKILEGIVISQGADYVIEETKPIEAVVNDKELVIKANKWLGELIGTEKVLILPYGAMTGEDFCYFSTRVPSLFLYIGNENKEKNIVAPLHNNKFIVDDNILVQTIEAIAYMTVNLLLE